VFFIKIRVLDKSIALVLIKWEIKEKLKNSSIVRIVVNS